MSENELFGLMAVAQEQQKAAAAAQASAAKATEAMAAAVAAMPRAAQEAARAAGAALAVEMKAETERARQSVAQTASVAQAALRGVSWAWVGLAFAVGLAVGVAGMAWYYGGQLDHLTAYAQAIYGQTPQGQQATRQR